MTKFEQQVVRQVIIQNGSIHCTNEKQLRKAEATLLDLGVFNLEFDDASERHGVDFSVFVKTTW